MSASKKESNPPPYPPKQHETEMKTLLDEERSDLFTAWSRTAASNQDGVCAAKKEVQGVGVNKAITG